MLCFQLTSKFFPFLRNPSSNQYSFLLFLNKNASFLRKFTPFDSGGLCFLLLRADSSLKTVVEARKFVPGSNLCIQPNINPNAHRRSKNPKRERTRIHPPLLPGLPDDLAVACLIRVSRSDHRKLRLVCKSWHRLASGNFFYSERKLHGISEEWVYVFKKDRDRKISWNAFDPVSHHHQPLPPVPREYSEAVGFGCAVLSGYRLYLFGGKDPIRGSMRKVVFYNAKTNKWQRGPNMLRKRHFIGSCVINNCLYVAGGECEGIQTLQENIAILTDIPRENEILGIFRQISEEISRKPKI